MPKPSAGRLWMPCPLLGTCCFALWSRGTQPRLPFLQCWECLARINGFTFSVYLLLSAYDRWSYFFSFMIVHKDCF